MVARHALVTVAAIAIATSCVGGTITPSPSPAPSATPTAEPSVAAASLSPSPSPSPTLTASPTATVRATPTYPPPAADAAAGIGTIRSVRSAGITADGSRVVGVISTADGSRSSIDVLVVETGRRSTIAHGRPGQIQGRSLVSGMLAYLDTSPGPGGAGTFGVWRIDLGLVDPSPVRLDDFAAVPGFVFGHTGNTHWPAPKTNGRDVVWLRSRETAGTRTYELVTARGIATPQVIHSARRLVSYEVDDGGRIAFATTIDGAAILSLYDPATGRVRELARRSAEQGELSWVNGRVAWFDHLLARADLYDAATGTSSPFDPPTGCELAYPTTSRHVLVRCLGGLVAAHDLVTGRIVPLAPVVLASPGALLMRSTAEDEKGPDAWLHAAVLPP